MDINNYNDYNNNNYNNNNYNNSNYNNDNNETVRATVQRHKKVFSNMSLGLFLMAVIVCAIQIALIYFVGPLCPEFFTKYYNIITLLPITVIGLPTFFIMNKMNESAPKIEQKFEFGVKQFIPFIFISFAVVNVFNVISSLINIILAMSAGKEVTNAVSQLIERSSLWQNTLMFAILAPILEELIFRKLLIDKFSRFGEGVAILVSAVMFGLYHGNIVQFIYATALGLVLGYVYSKSKNIIFTIIIHVFINFNSGVLGGWVVSATNILEISSVLKELSKAGDPVAVSEYALANISGIAGYYAYSGIVGAINIAGIVLFIITLVKHRRRGQMLLPGAEKLVKGKKFQTIVLNVGAVLYILFWIFMIVFNIISTYFI